MFLTIIVLSMIIIILIRAFLAIWSYLKRKDFVWDTNNGRYWAVITGSTDGIGFEFARQLASKGYNLIMLSRSDEKLSSKRQAIMDEFPNVQIKTLAVNFKHADIYDQIQQFLLPDLDDIFILVNNVGYAGKLRNDFVENFQMNWDMIHINIISATRMTELILSKMLEKKRGLIVNVSSIEALHESPTTTMYASTKAFLSYFSRCLNFNYSSKNVLIYVLHPTVISTNMFPVKDSILAPKPRVFVQSALKSINWTTPESCGYLPHTVLHWAACILENMVGWNAKTRIMAMVSNKFKQSLESSFEVGSETAKSNTLCPKKRE